jgi:hypothetical protein
MRQRSLLLFLGGFLMGAAPALAQQQVQGPPRYDKADTRVPQYALSTCPVLRVETTENVLPGTELAMSPSGQFRAEWVHTPQGAELTIIDRDKSERARIELPAPPLPPGIAWRVLEAKFSPDSQLLAIRSVGRIWVADAAEAKLLYSINVDLDKQLWPGSFTWSEKHLGVTFWPPESILADAPTKGPVMFDLYEAASGAGILAVPLNLPSSDAWLEPVLSPDASQLAVLERARNWPGTARLVLLATVSGQVVWEKKLSAEDIAWSDDGSQILALGKKLTWISAKDGHEIRHSATDAGASEYQRLKFSEASGVAAASFSLYSAFHRLFSKHQQETELIVLWDLKSGEELCSKELDAGTSLELWLTARKEIVTLEELYDIRPSLRLLKAAQVVTYKILQKGDVNSQPSAPVTGLPEIPATNGSSALLRAPQGKFDAPETPPTPDAAAPPNSPAMPPAGANPSSSDSAPSGAPPDQKAPDAAPANTPWKP